MFGWLMPSVSKVFSIEEANFHLCPCSLSHLFFFSIVRKGSSDCIGVSRDCVVVSRDCVVVSRDCIAVLFSFAVSSCLLSVRKGDAFSLSNLLWRRLPRCTSVSD